MAKDKVENKYVRANLRRLKKYGEVHASRVSCMLHVRFGYTFNPSIIFNFPYFNMLNISYSCRNHLLRFQGSNA